MRETRRMGDLMIETETGMSMRGTEGRMIGTGTGTEVVRGIGMTMTGIDETGREIGLVTGTKGTIATGAMTTIGTTMSDLDHLPARALHRLPPLPNPPLLPPPLPLLLPRPQHLRPLFLLQRT